MLNRGRRAKGFRLSSIRPCRKQKTHASRRLRHQCAIRASPVYNGASFPGCSFALQTPEAAEGSRSMSGISVQALLFFSKYPAVYAPTLAFSPRRGRPAPSAAVSQSVHLFQRVKNPVDRIPAYMILITKHPGRRKAVSRKDLAV